MTVDCPFEFNNDIHRIKVEHCFWGAMIDEVAKSQIGLSNIRLLINPTLRKIWLNILLQR